MTFAQRRNRLTTHFSDGIFVVKRRMTVFANDELRGPASNSSRPALK